MHRSSMLLALVVAMALSAAALAYASSPSGSYKGTIGDQGHGITFKVKGGKISKLVARMLVDCDGTGHPTRFVVAPDGSWSIRNGTFSGRIVRTSGRSTASVSFQGKVTGGKVTGFVRERDTVAGGVVVCDTLERTFTATRR